MKELGEAVLPTLILKPGESRGQQTEVFKKKSSRRRVSVYRADGDRFADLLFLCLHPEYLFQL
ncbi:MAG: hypothetical protein ACLVJ6_10570 [Merdibacter sp.]